MTAHLLIPLTTLLENGQTDEFLVGYNIITRTHRHITADTPIPTNSIEHSQTLLHYAARYNNAAVARNLIAAKASLNSQSTDDKVTPLFLATQKGHVKMTKLLLKHKADPDIPERDGAVPLHMAAYHGHTDVARHLLQSGANPDIAMLTGATPLHIAASRGDAAITALLLQAGAYPIPYDADEKTPFDYALKRNHPDVAALLQERVAALEKTAFPDAQASLKHPLSAAAFFKKSDDMQRIILSGAPLPQARFRFHGNQHSGDRDSINRIIDYNRFFQAGHLLLRDQTKSPVLPIMLVPGLVILAYSAVLKYDLAWCPISAAPNNIITPDVAMSLFVELGAWQKRMDDLLANSGDYPLADEDRKSFFALCHPEKVATPWLTRCSIS